MGSSQLETNISPSVLLPPLGVLEQSDSVYSFLPFPSLNFCEAADSHRRILYLSLLWSFLWVNSYLFLSYCSFSFEEVTDEFDVILSFPFAAHRVEIFHFVKTGKPLTPSRSFQSSVTCESKCKR